jgi:Holliday junction resolvase RusA-like endonuclease
MRELNLIILGTPKPKQSARFYAKGNKVFSFQKKEVVENERNIAFDVKSQLPVGFVPYDEPIGVEVVFVFPIKETMKKKEKEAIENGEYIYKDTKPDLHDNLCKGLFDALEGLVYVNDSRICMVKSAKIYGVQPRIELKITPLNASA